MVHSSKWIIDFLQKSSVESWNHRWTQIKLDAYVGFYFLTQHGLRPATQGQHSALSTFKLAMSHHHD